MGFSLGQVALGQVSSRKSPTPGAGVMGRVDTLGIGRVGPQTWQGDGPHLCLMKLGQQTLSQPLASTITSPQQPKAGK